MISIRSQRAGLLTLVLGWSVASALISGCSSCGKESTEDAPPGASNSPATHVDNQTNDHLGSQRQLPPYARPGMRVGVTPASEAGAN